MNQAKPLVMISALVLLTWSGTALAEGEGNASPDQSAAQPAQQQQGDAWDQAMRQGMHQEGRMTKDQVVEHEKAEQVEIDAHEALRKTLRICGYLGFGGGLGLENRLENSVTLVPVGGVVQFGAGIRKGISLNWEFQGRGLITFMTVDEESDYYYYNSSSRGPSTSTSSDPDKWAYGLSLDGTARYHFGGITKPFYFGFGGRFDFLRLGADQITSTRIGSFAVADTKTTSSSLHVMPLVQTEIGVVLMDAQRVDLAIRVAAGLGFHAGAMAGVAF